MRVSSITKNAGKACNNRLYRHIRTFEKIIKNYFVIWMKTYEPKVTMLSYSQADDCFYIDNGIQDGHIKAFEKELIKESLYLKHIAQ